MHSNLKKLLFFLLVNFAAFPLWSQVVWPGDVNNNGVVNSVDWLYLSYAFGEAGPPRPFPEMGVEWEAKNITSLWGANIPGTSVDFVFADCNGDGVVNEADFEAIEFNFFEEHDVVNPEMGILGEGGSDPELFLLEDPIIPFPQGGVLFLELFLGTDAIPVPNLSGLAFDIEYDPDVISQIFFIPVEGNEGWGAYDLMPFQTNASFGEGTISFAFSTNGVDNIVNGSGLLGQLFIVIEDDVVGMQDPIIETSIMLENVILLGGEELDISPVLNDTIVVTVVENPLSTGDFLDPGTIEVFPNPAFDYVYLKTSHDVNRVEVFNTVGRRIKTFEGNYSAIRELDLSDFAVGIHLFKFYTDEGVLTKKIVLH